MVLPTWRKVETPVRKKLLRFSFSRMARDFLKASGMRLTTIGARLSISWNWASIEGDNLPQFPREWGIVPKNPFCLQSGKLLFAHCEMLIRFYGLDFRPALIAYRSGVFLLKERFETCN